jgi:hypothetical protein
MLFPKCEGIVQSQSGLWETLGPCCPIPGQIWGGSGTSDLTLSPLNPSWVPGPRNLLQRLAVKERSWWLKLRCENSAAYVLRVSWSKLLVWFFVCLFCGTGAWTQGLHLEPLHSLSLWWFFSREGLKNCLLGLALSRDPPDLCLLSS